MTVDDAIALLDQFLQPEGLNDLQASVFRLCWQGKGYQDIAAELGYDSGYIRTVGSNLWKQLSELLGKKVTKSNLHTIFRQYAYPPLSISPQKSLFFSPEFPGLPLNLDSPLYIERPPIEQRCYQKILHPGGLIRIQAPTQMGKTSLLYRLLGYAQNQGYQTLRLSCEEATAESFTNLNSFLRWLCRSLTRKLRITPNLDQYWDHDPSFAKSNCTHYLEDYVLPKLDTPLVIALDDVERVFTYPNVAADFLPLLRVWHEEANENEIWQSLRLIVVHSTEAYVPLDIHQSPFNVGLPIYLPDLSLEQVQALALKYHLDWAAGNIGQELLRPLLEMVGGHPYLIQLALYYLWEGNFIIADILENAPTDSGIYRHHLHRLFSTLKKSPNLCLAMEKLVTNNELIEVSPITAYKLQSLGLVNLVGNSIKIRYQLYYDYFRSRLNSIN
ncbi:MAG: AAA-like domain-containing protein [Cyanobacteriota bacterium]